MSKYTYEVNKDKSVTILREGSVCLKQTDDPATEGFDAFASKTRAEEWAKEAIAQYEADEIREASLKNALAPDQSEAEAALLAIGLASIGDMGQSSAEPIVIDTAVE